MAQVRILDYAKHLVPEHFVLQVSEYRESENNILFASKN